MYAVEWLVLFETYGWNYLSVLFNIYADSLACPCVKGFWSWRSISGTFFFLLTARINTEQYSGCGRVLELLGVLFFVNPGTVLTNIRTWCVSWYAEAALQTTCRLILGEIGASESPGGEFIFVCSVDCVTYLCLPLGTHNHATSVSRKKRASHERSVYTVNFSENFRKKTD